MTKAIAYYRVSTDRQGKSGLGLAAQREAVARHLGPDVKPIASYTETESGRKDDRPELRKALDHARRAGAVLVVAKLDRLARSAHFLLTVLNSGVAVAFADLPQVSGPQGKFLLTSMAAVAELEGAMISQRTKDALAAAKARGKRLGAQPGASPLTAYLREHGNRAAVRGKQRAANARAESWRGEIQKMLRDGLGNSAIARALNERGEHTVSGAGQWTATSVRRLRERLGMDVAATVLRCVEAA